MDCVQAEIMQDIEMENVHTCAIAYYSESENRHRNLSAFAD